ncbi:hypothetical protein [Afifella sp. IM 167]|uniref:hypothetical protein n=1 Tax=Afifella sp. IM 167 TaxID=2033586 RepID=UPI001CCDA22E|nr:hypothetical protein [Afifella sp. IM 167]MBZ8134918.1 hypothetical protein [Afifella sp. IM 167]
MTGIPETYGKAKDRRKKAPVKRVQLSAEQRQAYEDAMREHDRREREHSQYLPDDVRTRR